MFIMYLLSVNIASFSKLVCAWNEMSYLLGCFHIFSHVRQLPAAAIETRATDSKTL